MKDFKECLGCHEWIPIEGFSKHSGTKDGRRSRCKTCCVEYMRKYRKTPSYKRSAQKYREKYAEKIKEYNKEYYLRNKHL
jgi:hypothetical protein